MTAALPPFDSDEPQPRPAVPAELLGIRDVCALLGRCSARSVYRLCDAGKMPFGFKLNGMRRWRRDELLDWIAADCPPVRVAKGAAR
ncbi:MAG: helix-turn-helix domain-containing protein [Phycisphaerae bacterium]|jgi:predicted DNA-binding transcriptional regulator AlpA